MPPKDAQAKKAPPEFDPEKKEPWQIEFEEEPVNDEYWTCIVGAALPAQIEDEECINMFNQAAATKIRRSIRTITMNDVVSALKSTDQKVKVSGKTKEIGQTLRPLPRPSPILTTASKYATYAEGECQLPAYLMAAVLKCLILNIKDEDCFQRRLDRRKRETDLKTEFMKKLHPAGSVKVIEVKNEIVADDNVLGITVPVNDEPFGGPDVYILLSGFHNPKYFCELRRLKVPFMVVLRVENFYRVTLLSPLDVDVTEKVDDTKQIALCHVWDQFQTEVECEKTTINYKDILMLQYDVPNILKDSMEYAFRTIYDNISSILYSSYNIYRHHQSFLQQNQVQRVIESSEPLSLSRCDVYNSLSDALSPADHDSAFLVLFSMIEQVVAGVPETSRTPIEYVLEPTDFFESDDAPTTDGSEEPEQMRLVTPCEKCRGKSEVEVQQTSKSAEDDFEPSENSIPQSIITKLSEGKLETNKSSAGGQCPMIFFHGDEISLKTSHLHLRVLDPTSIIERFLYRTPIPLFWTKYKPLTPADRAYHDYQFFRLWETSGQSEDSLRFMIHFTIAMKLIGFTKSFLYHGAGQNNSELWDNLVGGQTASKPFGTGPKFNFESGFWASCFRIAGEFRSPACKAEKSLLKLDMCSLRKVPSLHEIAPLETYRTDPNETCTRCPAAYEFRPSPSDEIFGHDLENLYKIWECPKISSLNEPHFLSDVYSYEKLIHQFTAYESLEPNRMVQNLQSALENYNMSQYNYFPATDAIIIVFYNDTDYRGMFYYDECGYLAAPVAIRDFYNYVYAEDHKWVASEEEEHAKFLKGYKEELESEEMKKDAEYVCRLTREFALMSQEDKDKFLGMKQAETKGKKEDLKVTESSDLPELSKKKKPKRPNKISFLTTNFGQIRTQVKACFNEFHSRDGTSVRRVIHSRLYDTRKRLSLKIKKNGTRLYYHQWLNEEPSKDFHVITESGIVFAFQGNENAQENPTGENPFFYFKASWPTGLMIEVVPKTEFHDVHIKQNYLTSYAPGRGNDQEMSRSFLGNGQVLVFKKNGNVEIMCPDSTKYGCYEFVTPKPSTPPEVQPQSSKIVQKNRQASVVIEPVSENIQQPPITITDYDILTPNGEFWARSNRPKFGNEKKLITTFKVLIGHDKINRECYYRRDDGTSCMLWPDGTLVVSYPDGTKVTSIPGFDEEEVKTDWSDEEKLYHLQMKKAKEREISRTSSSQTILQNSESSYIGDTTFSCTALEDFHVESFAVVSCSYLMEHPKYCSVRYFSFKPYIEVIMPNVSIQAFKNGTYRMKLENDTEVAAEETAVKFFVTCSECKKKSKSSIFLKDDPVMCRTIDFFDKKLVIFRNGETLFDQNEKMAAEDSERFFSLDSNPSLSTVHTCMNYEDLTSPCNHLQSVGGKQRCFVLERDLSGAELIHEDVLTRCIPKQPDEHFFDLRKRKKCRNFSTPIYKLGHEKWMMEYESDNSLPTNLRKRDLRLLGEREEKRNLFRYRFPADQASEKRGDSSGCPTAQTPKAIVVRSFRRIDPKPKTMISKLKEYVSRYQKRARDAYTAYKNHSVPDDRTRDSRYLNMRLKKIFQTMNQSAKFYAHSSITTPSTDQDIHYFAHKENLNETLRAGAEAETKPNNLLPRCKEIPPILPHADRLSVIPDSSSL